MNQEPEFKIYIVFYKENTTGDYCGSGSLTFLVRSRVFPIVELLTKNGIINENCREGCPRREFCNIEISGFVAEEFAQERAGELGLAERLKGLDIPELKI